MSPGMRLELCPHNNCTCLLSIYNYTWKARHYGDIVATGSGLGEIAVPAAGALYR